MDTSINEQLEKELCVRFFQIQNSMFSKFLIIQGHFLTWNSNLTPFLSKWSIFQFLTIKICCRMTRYVNQKPIHRHWLVFFWFFVFCLICWWFFVDVFLKKTQKSYSIARAKPLRPLNQRLFSRVPSDQLPPLLLNWSLLRSPWSRHLKKINKSV